MRELLEALWYGFEKSRPILMTDTSEILRISLLGRLVNPAIPHRHWWGSTSILTYACFETDMAPLVVTIGRA